MRKDGSFDGGKNGSGVYQQIINLIPPHERYIEGCLGGGAIMKLKLPARTNVGIDKDPMVIGAWNTPLGPPSRGELFAELRLICGDVLKYLPLYNEPTDFVYLDPPYLMSVRSCKKKLYKHEMTEEEHIELLKMISGDTVRCMVMISGYENELYDEWLKPTPNPSQEGTPPLIPPQGGNCCGWWKHSFSTTKRNGKRAVETVWMNYPKPERLHDYRYVGDDYRERERIKLKIGRWKRKLNELTPLERNAILSGLSSQYDSASTSLSMTGNKSNGQ